MSDDPRRLVTNKPMPELHFVFAQDAHTQTFIVLDPDQTENMVRNLSTLPPMARRILSDLCEITLAILGDSETGQR